MAKIDVGVAKIFGPHIARGYGDASHRGAVDDCYVATAERACGTHVDTEACQAAFGQLLAQVGALMAAVVACIDG